MHCFYDIRTTASPNCDRELSLVVRLYDRDRNETAVVHPPKSWRHLSYKEAKEMNLGLGDSVDLKTLQESGRCGWIVELIHRLYNLGKFKES